MRRSVETYDEDSDDVPGDSWGSDMAYGIALPAMTQMANYVVNSSHTSEQFLTSAIALFIGAAISTNMMQANG